LPQQVAHGRPRSDTAEQIVLFFSKHVSFVLSTLVDSNQA
jgi:hypothetical protein